MKRAAAFPFRHPQHDAMTTPRGLLRLLLVTLCLSLAQPFAAVAQTNTPTPLPPAAQEAIDKGIIAAKVPDYLLAIRYFDEARKLAPQAPVVYLNLGLAESRIPGRELRAMAWFGAYLAAYPDAPNAAAVKEQIGVLDVRNQSNVLRLIKTVQDASNQISDQDAANKISGSNKEGVMVNKSPASVYKMPQLWVKAGDIASAQKAADLIQVKDDTSLKSAAQWGIAKAQVKAGDIAGAQKTADLIQYAFWKSAAMEEVAKAQAEAGDIAGAQKTADLIQDARQKSWAQFFIARAQAEVGDIAGAQKTADLIQGADDKRRAQSAIAAVQAKAGIANAPNSTRQSRSDTQPPIQPVITVSDWLKKLDDDNKKNDCPLNTERFLDLAGYLKSLPPPDYPDQVFVWGSAGRVGPLPRSGDPRRVLESLYETAEKIVDAQNVIRGMLKQQAKR
ncbi:tetratricopeptide repeat protein [Polaromonas sp.]|uniref:tetratricopeptide repeat protein n=1 Tax=Polaromonas sp. TaxID=1869339 RepID=UPI002FC7E1DF